MKLSQKALHRNTETVISDLSDRNHFQRAMVAYNASWFLLFGTFPLQYFFYRKMKTDSSIKPRYLFRSSLLTLAALANYSYALYNLASVERKVTDKYLE